MSLDGFADAANARVSLADGDRTAGGFGVAAETARAWKDGTLSLHGSLDLERTFGGADTAVAVSGETLRSRSDGSRLRVGLGGVWAWDRFSVAGELSAAGHGTGDRRYSASLALKARF